MSETYRVGDKVLVFHRTGDPFVDGTIEVLGNGYAKVKHTCSQMTNWYALSQIQLLEEFETRVLSKPKPLSAAEKTPKEKAEAIGCFVVISTFVYVTLTSFLFAYYLRESLSRLDAIEQRMEVIEKP